MNHSCYYKNKYSYHKKMSNRIFIFIYNQLVHAQFLFLYPLYYDFKKKY